MPSISMITLSVLGVITYLSGNTEVNALQKCSEQPDTLIGFQRPNKMPLSHQIDAYLEYQPTVLKTGGCFEPKTCEALQKVLIVVPYRDRKDHLDRLLFVLHPFLQRQQISYCIVVAEQTNAGKFNKGLLMNAAFQEFKNLYDFNCVVFHDVDMLPENDKNMYLCKKDPVHLSPKINKYNYRYPYGTDFGGVTMMSRDQYELVNGHTNLFWGWGKEDADMEFRLRTKSLPIAKPDDIDTGRYTMLGHVHTDTFQNEKFSIGMEDDRTSALKKQLMSMKGIRQLYDGLNSLAYRLVDIDQQLLYTRLEFDLQKIELKTAGIKIGKEVITVHTDSEDIDSCRFVKHEAYINRKYRYAGRGIKNVTLDSLMERCQSGCGGFTFDGAYHQFSHPIFQESHDLEKYPTEQVFMKSCANDVSRWQVFENDVILMKNDQKLNLEINFNGLRIEEDMTDLYYRDSWLFDGKQFVQNNFQVDKENPIVTENSTIIYKEEVNSRMVSLTVKLSIEKTEPGFYAIYSKITDAFGQPYYDLRYVFHLLREDEPELRLSLDQKSNFRAKFNVDRTEEMKSNMLTLFKREMLMSFEKYAKTVEAEENAKKL